MAILDTRAADYAVLNYSVDNYTIDGPRVVLEQTSSAETFLALLDASAALNVLLSQSSDILRIQSSTLEMDTVISQTTQGIKLLLATSSLNSLLEIDGVPNTAESIDSNISVQLLLDSAVRKIKTATSAVLSEFDLNAQDIDVIERFVAILATNFAIDTTPTGLKNAISAFGTIASIDNTPGLIHSTGADYDVVIDAVSNTNLISGSVVQLDNTIDFDSAGIKILGAISTLPNTFDISSVFDIISLVRASLDASVATQIDAGAIQSVSKGLISQFTTNVDTTKINDTVGAINTFANVFGSASNIEIADALLNTEFATASIPGVIRGSTVDFSAIANITALPTRIRISGAAIDSVLATTVLANVGRLSDFRTLTILEEDRTTVINSENRTISVLDENRTLTIYPLGFTGE